MDVLNVEYMLGLVPVLLGYLPLTLQLAGVGMVLALSGQHEAAAEWCWR